MNKLDVLREEIDKCDKELVAILEKRLGIVLEVMEYKRDNGLQIFHPEREQQLIGKVLSYVKNKDFSTEIESLFYKILEGSKKIQSKSIYNYNIVLIGFMGTGKSTIGKELSKQLTMDFIDIDEEIEKKENMAIREIFNKYGEQHFREIENNMVKLISKVENTVISCGGGVVLNPDNIEFLKNNGKIILLEASSEEILQRIKEDSNRPLLKGNMSLDHINEILEKRHLLYKNAADTVINTDKKEIKEICSEIISGLISNNC